MAKGRDTESWAYQQANSQAHKELMIHASFTDFWNKVASTNKRTDGEVAKHVELQPR